MSDPRSDGGMRFTEVELGGGGRRRPTAESAVFVGGTLAILAAYTYHWWISGGPNAYVPLAFDWRPTRIDWLTLFAAVVSLAAVVVPVVRSPSVVVAYWRAYPSDATSRWALAVVGTVVVVGIVGPAVTNPPLTDLQGTYQPPLGFGVATEFVSDCVGRVADGVCHGSLVHPLGTLGGGEDMVAWLAYGARTVVAFVALSTAIMVPVGVGVGVTAAVVGGSVDRILMGYVDVQTTIPTILIYFVVTFFDGVSLFGLVVAYGLFNWGSLARVVRTAARSELEADYVEAAAAAGASRFHLVRHHVLPNVASTVLVAVTLQIPKLILIEIGLAFLGFGGEDVYSWGQILQRGLLSGGYQLGVAWWIVVMPSLATALFVGAASVVGDGLRTALDA
ncbi:MAG: ABC transporter permease [Halobaculum sp.]